MEETKESTAAAQPVQPGGATPLSRLLQFGLHLGTVYVLVYFCSTWLAGQFHAWIIPLIDPGNRISTFQFEFSHVLAFTFIPAAVVGYINSQYWRHSAIFVWTIPTVVRGYKLITFHTTVFQNHFEAAFHYYFAGGFLIGEFYSYTDLFALGPTPDMFRGIDQLHITGPFYAGLGYSLAAFAAGYVPFSALAKLLPEHRSDAIPEEHEVEGP